MICTGAYTKENVDTDNRQFCIIGELGKLKGKVHREMLEHGKLGVRCALHSGHERHERMKEKMKTKTNERL